MREPTTRRWPNQLRTGSGLWLQLGAVALSATPAVAATPRASADVPVNSISYFLPKLTLELVGEFRVEGCDGVKVTPTYTLVQTYLPDSAALVHLDTSVGFLAKRSVKIELYPDATLKSFNGSWEGQGGKLVTAVAKLAITAATGRAGAADEASATCSESTRGKLAALSAKQVLIDTVEARLANGQGQSSDLATRDILLQQKSQLIKQLTITRRWTIEELEPASPPPVGAPDKLSTPCRGTQLDRVDYSALLSNDIGLPGRDGSCVTLAAAPGFEIADKARRRLPSPNTASPDLLYRRPVPAVVTIDPRVPGAEAPAKTFAILVPQWSAIHRLRLGKGGMFGSRSATAKFDATGMPTELSYGSTGASEGVAGLIDTAREGYGSLRDAELGQLKRQIDLAKARKELEALRAASDE